MSDPIIAQSSPYLINLEQGKTYFWCSCGRSKKQPFCDGSHSGTEFSPKSYKAEKDLKVLFCGCKHTKKPPFCDGSHKEML